MHRVVVHELARSSAETHPRLKHAIAANYFHPPELETHSNISVTYFPSELETYSHTMESITCERHTRCIYELQARHCTSNIYNVSVIHIGIVTTNTTPMFMMHRPLMGEPRVRRDM